jgi:protein SCO1/2
VPFRRGLIAGLALLAVVGCGQSAGGFSNIDITGAEYARDFELTDHEGRRRTMADFRGKVVAIFFGFTQCPDVCPGALAELSQTKQALGADADRLQVLFVTIDPQRDTAAVLKAYLANFDKQALGLYGDEAATARVAKEFKVFYQKEAGKTPDTYTMSHTAGIYLFDREGRIRLYVKYGTPTQALISDVRKLLA